MIFTVKFLNKLKSIKKYLVQKDLLFYLSESSLNYYDEYSFKSIKFPSGTIYLVDSNVFSGKNFYFNYLTKNIDFLDDLKDYYFTGISENNNLLFTGDDFIIYDFINRKSVLRSKHYEEKSIIKIVDKSFFCHGGDFISSHILSDGNKIWQQNFQILLNGLDVRQVGRILDIDGKLYLYLTDNKDSQNLATVCLDVKTGEVLNKYLGFAGNLFQSGTNIHVAAYQWAKTLDTLTNKITEYDLSSLLNPLNLQIHWEKSVFTKDGLLFFVDGHWATTNKIGAIDLTTQKLLWYHEIEITDGVNNNIQDIQVHGDRLYVHCSDNALHIFQIE